MGRRGDDPLRGVRGGGRPPDPGGGRRLARRRHRPLRDARLAEPRVDPGRVRDWRVRRALGRGPADHAYWERWFPAAWVSEMRERIRLWFYSQLFMSVALDGRAPFREVLGYEKMLDEHGHEMHGSWGNLIPAEEAFARMGADVMRWQYCAQPPDRNLSLRLRPCARDQAEAPDALELCPLPRRLRDDRGVPAVARGLEAGPAGVELAPLDRWLVRADALARDATEALEAQLPTVWWRRSRATSTTCRTGTSVARGAGSRLRRGCLPDALVRARPGRPRRLPGHALPRRPPLGAARP